MRTPWGVADQVKEVAPGILRVDTPSHGGYKLDRVRNAKVPEYLRRRGGWYEEDCDWAIAAMVHPEAFSEEQHVQAVKTVRNWHPDEYERFTGRKLAEGESFKRDEALFHQRHAQSWLTVSAVGDWSPGVPKGYVGVTAAIGGRSMVPPYTVPEPTKTFLVPADEYESRGRFGFVVDPSRHQEA